MFKFGKDESKCSGCILCKMVCVLHNKKECNPREAFIAIRGNFPRPGGYTVKWLRGCTFCRECLKICPTGAIFEKSTAEVQK